jgi:putative ABC transport system permease protein
MSFLLFKKHVGENLRLLTFAVKNLGRRKTRTGLTVLGIAIAIAFAFVLFSVSEGTEGVIANAKKLGPDIEVKRAENAGFQSGLGGYLDENYATALAGIGGVRKTAPVILSEATAHGGGGFTILLGMAPHDATEIYGNLTITDGRSLTDNDNFAIQLGYRVSKMNSLNVGDNFPLGGANFEVISVLAETGGIVDVVGLLRLSTFQSVLGTGNKVSGIWLWVEDGTDTKVVIDEIENRYPELEATEGIAILKQTEDFMKFGDAIRLAIAGIALLIGALAAMNTVTMSTIERTREFGAIRSLGASSGYVFKLVLIESMLLCIIGGLLGCLLGYAGSIVVDRFILNFVGIDIVATTLRTPLTVVGIAAAVGLIAGIYPAWRISRQQIVDALRYE